jgi:SHS2 domain-containing protein
MLIVRSWPEAEINCTEIHPGNISACWLKVEINLLSEKPRISDRGPFGFHVPGFHTADRSQTGWEHFPHVADIGVRGFGPTVAASFEQAAMALTSVVADLVSVRPVKAVEVHCEAPNIELLFMGWLNAVIFEMATRKMLFYEFHVRIDGEVLNGWARGEKIIVSRHRPAAEVKGATLSELEGMVQSS